MDSRIKLVVKITFDKKKRLLQDNIYIKKNIIITNILIDGKSKILKINVSGDDEGQITSFLAEIGNSIRQELIRHEIITSEDKFYDIRASILTNTCPYCMILISADVVQKYLNGEKITCEGCNTLLSLE